MKALASRLNKRITLQRKAAGKTPGGLPTVVWADVATVWAAVEPLLGREYFAAAAAQAENNVRFRLRYRAGITPEMRVMYNGRSYDIVSVLDPYEQHREIVLMCREAVGDVD